MTKKKYFLIILYIISATLISIYINSILKRDEVSVYEEEKQEATDIYNVNVTLQFIYSNETKEFKRERKNTDSVNDLLQEIRSSEGFEFEIISYTYGIEIESVNKIIPPKDYKWAVLYQGEDITNKLGEKKLDRGDIFELKLIRK